jgi:hypothetical protein
MIQLLASPPAAFSIGWVIGGELARHRLGGRRCAAGDFLRMRRRDAGAHTAVPASATMRLVLFIRSPLCV